jgi:hypothetical protein
MTHATSPIESTPISALHGRILRMITARDSIPFQSDTMEAFCAIDAEVDELTQAAVQRAVECPTDAMALIDLVWGGLENVHDDQEKESANQVAIRNVIVALAALVEWLNRTGAPLRDAATVSGLRNLVGPASIIYGRTANA